MRKRTRVVFWIVIGLAVIAIFAATAQRRLRTQEVQSIEAVQSAEGIPVDYVVARVIPLADWRRFVGTAEGFDQVDLTADYRTRVSAVHARVGEQVPSGRVIVALDQYDPARIMVNLETARAQDATARRDSIRMENLYASGAISEQNLDHARAEADRARAAYSTARRAVMLDSPISGVVTALYVQGGDYADAEQILATVSSLDRMRIPLDIGDAERRLIRVGQDVRLPLEREPSALSDRHPEALSLKGRVEKVSLSADPETRLFRVDLVVENPHHLLKPGSLVNPEIKIAGSDSSPVVPRIALVEQTGRNVLFIVTGPEGNRHAEMREVRPGVSGRSLVAVDGGVAPGEWVVVWGQSKLKDGLKVAPHDDLTSEYFDGEAVPGGLR